MLHSKCLGGRCKKTTSSSQPGLQCEMLPKRGSKDSATENKKAKSIRRDPELPTSTIKSHKDKNGGLLAAEARRHVTVEDQGKA